MKRKYFVGPVAVLGALFLFFSNSALAAGRQFLHGHLPPATSSLQPIGRLAATNHLRLAIGLPLRDQTTLSNLLHDLYDPNSPQFHHYLTPEEFAQRFGPSEADYQALTSFARANGLRITATHPNRVLLDVDASVGDIERILHVRMLTYRHPTENRDFYAPDTEPSLDLDIPVLHISGLDNYSLPRPRLQTVRPAVNSSNPDNSPAPDGATPVEIASPTVSSGVPMSPSQPAGESGGWSALPNAGSGASGSYMGADFRAAYAPGVSLNGSGQSVGLLQFDGYTAADITYYESKAGLPSVTLSNILIDGATGLPSGSGGEVEVSLDIEMSLSMAPGLSKIYLYEAANPSPFVDILSRMANDNLAKQLSCSWYQPNGPSNLVADQIFQQMAAQGQTFFSASGDNDAYTGLIPFPGDTPFITEVGGTTLTTTGPAGPYVSETVWNRGNGIGTGGGISTQYPIPTWQTNINTAPILGSSTMRNVPDVALTAENVDVRADGADQVVGGTSCAAPLWAGFTALINQQAANFGKPSVGFLNPAVYAIGAQASYPLIFHDTTNGNNTSSSSPAKFYAATGYDLCTGWGTPTGQKLIDALMPPLIVSVPASATEGAGLLAGAGQIQLPAALGTNVTVTLACTDPSQVSVPANITILAGQTNATFDLTILDDGVLDGTQIATITASVPGIASSSASITIFDKETATLQVQLPTSVTKGQGAVSGTVQVSSPVGANVTVSLSSSASTLIQVPSSVVISTGQTSAVFTATVLTDGQINGGQSVNVTAHVQNWTDGVAAISVQDNVNLSVSLPASAWENAGVLTNAGSVSLAGTPVTNVTVTLISSNPSKLIVPASVTILAGTLSNTFNVTPVYSPLVEGHQTITVTASAPGFTNGAASMLVLDLQTPPFPANPRPGNFATNVPANTNLMWVSSSNGTELISNGGFESGTFAGWTQVTNTANSRFYINNGTLKPFSPDPALPPYAGSFSALGDENGAGIFYMYQTVSIPTNITFATLSWAHRIRNFYSAFGSTQEFQVRVCDTNNNVLATPFTTNPGDPLLQDWVQNSYDMSSFAGKTVRVMFWLDPGSYYLDVHLDNVSLQINASATNVLGAITNDVYFGTNPNPGPAQYLGSTTNTSWTLPLLAPQTTYYWQIIAHRVGSATGAVWQFTTAGVDHFAWNNISSPQLVNQPFGVTITAQDAFNHIVTNFSGQVSLQCLGAASASTTIEDFESGTWPHAPWVSVQGLTLGTLATTYAHDGNYGLSDPDWIYRTDVSLGKAGDNLSWWVRPGTGRAYLGFGASSNGCWSIAACPNTSQFLLERNSAYGFVNLLTNTQSWVAGKWYRVAVRFSGTNSITCNLYDSDGATLLNTLSYTGITGLPGGVAMRSFGGFSLDTIASGPSASASLPLSPTNSGIFVNGVWNGAVAVLQPATNIVLRADDGSHHTGSSNPFDVDLTNDLSVSILASPNPAFVGSNLTYTLTIANTGPSDATGVTLTNILPAAASFLSVASSQGTASQSGGLVVANLGVVHGGTNATVTIVVAPTTSGSMLTNAATVSRAEPDAYLANNAVTNVLAVAPSVSIADSSCLEGNVGTTNMLFAVTLNAPFSQTASVYFATADGIAIAGKDYVSTNGILTFPPGVTNETIAVAVIGNTLVEPNKTFFVNLSNPINATLSRSQAVGTIINDDGLPGQLDHFVWSVIPSPQFVGTAFPVTISALDVSNNPATNFNGLAYLSGAGDHGVISLTPTSVGPFSLGQWTGSLTVNTLDTNIVLTASDANGHTNSSNPFYMIGVGSTFIPATNRVDMVEDSLRNLLYITAGNQVLRYNLSSGTFLTPFVFGANLHGIDISPDNNTLVVADSSGSSSNVWVYAVDLPSGTNRQITFPQGASLGTYAVAFGYDGAAIISGAIPLLRLNPVSGTFTVVGNPTTDSMVSSSGDGRIVAIAEAGISSGPLDRYDVASQTITGTVDDGWFNFEVAVNRDGSQYAVPTYGGTYIYDTNLNQIGLLGTYATEGPIGGAYDPQADLAFFAWWPTSFLRAYETHTLAQVASYDCGYNFGWTGNGAFGQGRVRISRDGNNLFVTVANGVRWISRPAFPPADLALSLASSPASPVNAGSNLTYTISVSNTGPNTVTDARVFDRLPAGVTFVSATSPQGTCVQSNGLVTCALNPLTNGSNATVIIVVTPPVQAILTNTAAVCSGADTNAANNFATLLTTVNGSASLSVTPASGLVASGTTGGPFNASVTYTLTNTGTASLNWSAGYSSNWISLSAANGILAPGAATTVTVSINSAADSLPAGSYSDSVTFTNLTNGNGNTARSVSLTIIPVGILNVTPAAGFASFGPRGGPFVPAYQVYVLTNSGDGSLTWTVSNTSLSFDLSATTGTLAPATATNVVVSLDNTTTNLPRGIYTSLIGFTNLSSGRGNVAYTASLTVNSPPVALPQTVTLLENGSLVITLQGTDADNDPLTAYITTLPAHGVLSQTLDGTTVGAPITSVPTVVSNASGKVIFSLPQNGYGNGYGNFQFKVNDGIADSSNALVTVNVTHVNHPPVAVNDTATFVLGTAHVSFNVLNNDSDPDNDPLTVQSFTLPARGTLTQTTNGLFNYQPNPGFTNGQDQFNYTINDGHGGTASAQVTIKAYTQYLNGGDWPTFGNGPSHTGYYPAMLGGSQLVASWSTNFGIALNQVATGAGNVYVTPITYFSATNFTALNAASGQPVWQTGFVNVFSINPPTFDNGRVYVQVGQNLGGGSPMLWSFNATNGTALWSSSFGAQWERYFAPTVVSNGIWMDGGYYGGLYGFNTNGSQMFFYSGLAQYDQWTPTWYQGTIYTWVAGQFRAHDPTTGNVLWQANFNWNWAGWSMNTASAIDGGRAFVAQPPNLIAINLTTHTNDWIATNGFTGSPAVANGIVYAISGDGVQTFSAQSGAQLGFYEATNDTGLAWQPIVTDDTLFVSSSSATYVFDLGSRRLLQTIPFGGPLSIANGRLYLAGQDGGLRTYTVLDTNRPPVILVHPVSQTVLGGSNVTFTVSAVGSSPLGYSWQKNNSALPGGNGNSLLLPSVVRTNSGSYNVIIRNMAGTTISSNATLVVHVPELLSKPTWLPDGTLLLTADDLGGGTISAGDLANFTAQASSNLINWVTLPGALSVTNGALQLHDVTATNSPMKFYRILEKW